MNTYAGLCDIADRVNNKDELCSLNFTYTDKNCLQHYSVPERIKEKE